MSLNFTVQPGKIMGASELVTNAKLNQIAVPVIRADGVISAGDMGAGDYSAILTPGDYLYAAATLSGANYTAAYNPAVTTYVDGLEACVKVNATNPANPTLDIGAGAKPLWTPARAVYVREIPANAILTVRYNSTLNGTGAWQVTNVLRETPVPEFAGATAQYGGLAGLVPPPSVAQQTYVLRGNGNWESIAAEIDARILANATLLNALPLYLSSH